MTGSGDGKAAVCAMIITCIEVGWSPSPVGEALTCVEVVQLDAARTVQLQNKLEMLMKEKKTEYEDRQE